MSLSYGEQPEPWMNNKRHSHKQSKRERNRKLRRNSLHSDITGLVKKRVGFWPVILVIVVLIFVFFFASNEKARASIHDTTTSIVQQVPKRVQEPYYLVTLELKQSTFTLDIGEHIKNKMNASTMTIAVDKRFYDKIRVGQELSNTFKGGSLLFNGDFSRMKVKVTNKRISKNSSTPRR